MTVHRSAFGLRLEASFPLPGVRAGGDLALPTLLVELVEGGQLERCWSGAAAAPDWVGLLGDGRELRLERGTRGDRLFSYGDHARFHLDAGAMTLRCVPADDELDWQRALLTKVIPTVAVLRGYEALHASAVETPSGAVALLAPSGVGKTTLALELLSRGSRLIGDDILALSEAEDGVLAHPATPHMNLDLEVAERMVWEGHVEALAHFGDEGWVSARSCATEAQKLSAVFLLSRRPQGQHELLPLTPSPLRLAPYMLGVSADTGRRRDRFGLYGTLAAQAALFELSFACEDSPEALAETILQAVEGRLPVGAT